MTSCPVFISYCTTPGHYRLLKVGPIPNPAARRRRAPSNPCAAEPRERPPEMAQWIIPKKENDPFRLYRE